MAVWAVMCLFQQVTHTNNFGLKSFLKSLNSSNQGHMWPKTCRESQNWFRCISGLVRVSRGCGWLSEQTCVSFNKSLNKYYLWMSRTLPSVQSGHQGQIQSHTCRENQNWFRCSVSLVRVSEGRGWLSELSCSYLIQQVIHTNNFGFQPFLSSNQTTGSGSVPKPTGRDRTDAGVVWVVYGCQRVVGGCLSCVLYLFWYRLWL